MRKPAHTKQLPMLTERHVAGRARMPVARDDTTQCLPKLLAPPQQDKQDKQERRAQGDKT